MKRMLPSPKEIFDQLVKDTPNFKAKCYNDDRACTEGNKGFFRRLGERLGFTVREARRPSEFLKLDQVWMEGGNVILAMEHENVVDIRPDAIEDEWKKLVNVKARMKVLTTYQSDPNKRNEMVKRASRLIESNPLRLPEEVYLLILGSHGEEKTGKDPFIRYSCYVFNNLGKVIEQFRSGTISMNR